MMTEEIRENAVKKAETNDKEKLLLYSVEFVEPFTNVVCYRELRAADPEDAWGQIARARPDVTIRAVSRVSEPTRGED